MNDVKSIQGMKTLPVYSKIMEKLTINPMGMTDDEKLYLLTCAIMLIKKYEKDERYSSYVELAYYIILKYSLSFSEFEPLYDFAVNFGFYPIAQAITNDGLLTFSNITSSLVSNQICEKYEKNGFVEILEQKITREKIIEADNKEVCYVAPTSFGKSSLIIEHIKAHWDSDKKIAIIVPTKSLLMQTYRLVRNAEMNVKILIHDEMYDDEEKFVAVFTQERALRLLDKKDNLAFDVLYIDEAHRIFDRDSRSILLLRLIKKNRIRNINTRVIYLSPLITEISNLTFEDGQKIFEQRIKFNIKEPEYFEYRTDGKVYKYNRFIDNFFEVDACSSMFDYIHKYKTDKTFCYLYSPRKIEDFTKNLASNCECMPVTDSIRDIIKNLSLYVHEDFYAIEYVKKGIIYLHGKMPDSIKEYLEYKYAQMPEIKYLVANKVVLEGMNFPIDSLFILNGTNLKGKELTNLIGRVNRLDQVFGKQNNLQKLMPPIHFVNSDEYNRKDGKFENRIRLLKQSIFEDNVKNPLLKNFDISKEPSDVVKEKCKLIIKDEESYFSVSSNTVQILKQKMIALGMNSIYILSNELCNSILKRMDVLRKSMETYDIHFLDRLRYVFVRNIDADIVDEEFRRLKNDKAIAYYKMYFGNRKKSMKENISLEVAYFERRKAEGDNLLFIGDSYGEVPYITSGREVGRNVYINLNQKTKQQMVNIAIVKLKLEEDFVGFKLHKFFQLMLDYELLTIDEYNIIIYGTTDYKKLSLVKMGLTINIINRLEDDGQLENISVDVNNNLYSNDKFKEYKERVDDFYRFELNKFL